MTAYFVAVDGAQTGPFTIEEVQVQCSRGTIRRDTLMWRDGLADWQRAEQVLQGTGISFSAEITPPPFPGSVSQSHAAPADQELRFAVPAASLSAASGTRWVGEGWKLFTAAPGMWIVAVLIWFGVQLLLAFVPVLGSLAGVLLGPSFAVGLLAFAHGISSNGKADLGALLAGFKDRLGALVILGLLYFVLMLAVVAIAGVLFFMLLGSAFLSDPVSFDQLISTLQAIGSVRILLFSLVVFSLIGLLLMAYLYAPALVLFANQSAGDAMKESFAACCRNWLPLSILGLVFIPLIIIASLPFGIGLLVVLPLLFAAHYVSFKEMFEAGQ